MVLAIVVWAAERKFDRPVVVVEAAAAEVLTSWLVVEVGPGDRKETRRCVAGVASVCDALDVGEESHDALDSPWVGNDDVMT